MTVQLDLFADSEAAERERLIDSAPCLFDIESRGFRTRVAMYRKWVAEFGSVLADLRSHAWHPGITQPAVLTDECRPTILSASLGCHHPWEGIRDCQCVGKGGVNRGACLHCDWEGELRADESAAVEDAHDHAWPGWRDVPIAPKPPMRGTSKAELKASAKWLATVTAVYPAGWVEAGGPIRTRRTGFGTRHVPGATGFGGYDMCGEVEP